MLETIGYSKYPYHLSIGVVAIWKQNDQSLVALGHHFDGQVRLPTETPRIDESIENTIKRLGQKELGANLKILHFLGSAKQMFFRPIKAEQELFEDPSKIDDKNPCIVTLENGIKATVIEKTMIFFLTQVTDFITKPVLEDNKYITYGNTIFAGKDLSSGSTKEKRLEVKVEWVPFNQALVALVENQRAEYKILRRAYKLCRL